MLLATVPSTDSRPSKNSFAECDLLRRLRIIGGGGGAGDCYRNSDLLQRLGTRRRTVRSYQCCRYRCQQCRANHTDYECAVRHTNSLLMLGVMDSDSCPDAAKWFFAAIVTIVPPSIHSRNGPRRQEFAAARRGGSGLF